ncbi:hypothetical protein [Methanosarcina siciliae]|uniref:hypothetical protein n=1 Tax=Methanosarcina siciliae TaxID=38027 RepID=UPI00064F7DD9|nr:hypothetical protein [Methanosarcina siciliae]
MRDDRGFASTIDFITLKIIFSPERDFSPEEIRKGSIMEIDAISKFKLETGMIFKFTFETFQ